MVDDPLNNGPEGNLPLGGEWKPIVPSTPGLRKYLSFQEAAEMLGVTQDELDNIRQRGQVRAFADRGTWKFKREDLQRLMQALANPPEEPPKDELPIPAEEARPL